jgi:hypothetical protein
VATDDDAVSGQEGTGQGDAADGTPAHPDLVRLGGELSQHVVERVRVGGRHRPPPAVAALYGDPA